MDQLTEDGVSRLLPTIFLNIRLPLTLAFLLISGCGELPAELFEETPRPGEAYRASLQAADLLRAPLGLKWMRAGDEALRVPSPVDLPFREVGFFEPGRPEAVAYRVPLRRGDALEVRIQWFPTDSSELFVDLFQAGRDGSGPLRLLDDEAMTPDTFTFEPRRDRDYVLLLRPPLLAEGRYDIELRRTPTLAFPVGGHGPGSIRSVFGDVRDGGRRSHHGVDIFADRGTPAVAGVAGVVSRVDTTRLGGQVVWLRDRARSQSLYYAHLDSQTVVSGQRVQVGDTLGLVGNTGNARTTPPHLHFGIYRRGDGPLDPVPFIDDPDEAVLEPTPLHDGITWWRTSSARTLLRDGAWVGATELDTLGAGTPLRVLGAAGGWARVEGPDGTRGYVDAGLLALVDEPLSSRDVGPDQALLLAPTVGGAVRAQPSQAETVEVLGRYRSYEWVALSDGTRGWLSPEPPQS